jgi:hypothetical protein
MSRSYYKYPSFSSDGPNHRRYAKRQANKKVRRTKNIPNGCAYRKVYNPWNIVDFRWVYYTKIEIFDSIEKYPWVKYHKVKSRQIAGV